MLLQLAILFVVAIILGVIFANFAKLAGLVLLVLFLIGSAAPLPVITDVIGFVTGFIPPGAELLFLAGVLIGIGLRADSDD